MKEIINQFNTEITRKIDLNYLVFLPEDYESVDNKQYPLLVFLHGAGERGNDIEKVKNYGIPEILSHADLPFILICPQCPDGTVWSLEIDALSKLLEEIKRLYKIDDRKVFLSGLSMRGYGTWDFAMKFPDKLTAIAPICGGAIMPEKICTLKDLPVWAFHGEKDKSVPIENTKRLVSALEKIGGNVRYTYYPEIGHNCWGAAYKNPNLFRWLLEQTK
ncbi:dienelactone hydrolase family protein [Peribacillus sp. SCS-155]|uniref:carboxylesterase family protein n=1 Tax=Peribacillus sedimenti TaxID=3115297 RepID=UPI0039067A2C